MRRSDFERLYNEHAEPLYGFLVYRTGDPTLAEDLLADTFERALRGRAGFRSRRGSEKTWLYAIALNCLRDSGRRQGAERRALERVPPAPEAAEATTSAVDDRVSVIDALANLSVEEHEAVALRFGADLTVPEVAQVTGLPLSTVEGRVYRALGKLRGVLG